MSTSPTEPMAAPSTLGGVLAIGRLHWLRQRRSTKPLWSMGLIALLVLGTTVAAHIGTDPDRAALLRDAVHDGFLRLAAIVLALIHASGAISEDARAERLSYITARPVGRTSLVLGLYVGSSAWVAALLVGGIALVHVGIYALSPAAAVAEWSATASAMGAAALIGALYCAICLCWSAVAPEAAAVVSTLYFAVIELTLSFAPGVFRLASMNHLASQLAGVPTEGLLAHRVPVVPAMWIVLAIAVETVVFLTIAAGAANATEYRYGKS